jgi:hypothetical protein
MPPVGLEPAIPASERPQTHALDRVATGTGTEQYILNKISTVMQDTCVTGMVVKIRADVFVKTAVFVFSVDKCLPTLTS